MDPAVPTLRKCVCWYDLKGACLFSINCPYQTHSKSNKSMETMIFPIVFPMDFLVFPWASPYLPNPGSPRTSADRGRPAASDLPTPGAG